MDINLDWQATAQAIGAAVTALVAVAGFLTGPGELRSRLKTDIDLLERLPDKSAAHTRMLEHIDSQIAAIAKLDTGARRDITGAVIAALLTVGLGWLALFLFDQEHGPWGIAERWAGWDPIWTAVGVFSVVCAAAGLSSMFDALQRVPRDDNDKRI